MAANPTTVSISCLCGNVSAQDIQISLGPLKSPPSLMQKSLCHCNACRSTSGVLCTSYYDLLTPYPDSLVQNPYLKSYVQSSQVSRWFCRVCGAHVLAYLNEANKYLVTAGLVTPASSSASEVECIHWGVGDTRDGGISIFLPGSTNDNTPCLLLESTNSESFSRSSPPEASSEKEQAGTDLRAQCHCGGINFAITRPNDRSTEPWSPWPDLIVPYHLASPKNIEDVKWWLRADNKKYLAGTCACNSCRLASGFPIQCWVFVPRTNLVNQADTFPDRFTYDTGTLQQYESSPGVYREFCRTCGATAFWHCNERPGVVDVSIGLLRSSVGARAEDWLDWATERVSFAEDAQDKLLIDLLGKGLQSPVY